MKCSCRTCHLFDLLLYLWLDCDAWLWYFTKEQNINDFSDCMGFTIKNLTYKDDLMSKHFQYFTSFCVGKTSFGSACCNPGQPWCHDSCLEGKDPVRCCSTSDRNPVHLWNQPSDVMGRSKERNCFRSSGERVEKLFGRCWSSRYVFFSTKTVINLITNHLSDFVERRLGKPGYLIPLSTWKTAFKVVVIQNNI